VHVPLEPLTLDASARWLDRRRRVLGGGQQAGFDISDFVTATDSTSSGSARTVLADVAATLELGDRASVLVETRWLDHEEDFKILQVDVTRYPTLNTTTTTTTDLWQETVQRAWEGSAQLDLEPVRSLQLTVGYGFEREWLKVPDLEAADFDFRRGSISTDGVILGAQWRPDARWTLKAGWRAFGQQGLNLGEPESDDLREVSGSVGHRRERWSLDATVRSRRSENDVALSSLESIVATATGTLRPGEDLDLHASFTFSDVNARTLTTFWFDPDPTPAPTYVGFQGDTYTVTSGLELRPCARVTWTLDGAWTSTTGDFDVQLWDVRADLSARVTRGGSAGLAVRWLDYEEQGGADDYDAAILLLYWRQRLGGK
jgi:hypothetical protein